MNAHAKVSSSALDAYRLEIRAHLAKEVLPYIDQWDELGWPIPTTVLGLGEARLLGRDFPVNLGGQGRDIWHGIALVEELARVPCGILGMAVASHLDIAAMMLARHAPLALAEEWVPRALSGEVLLALAVSEREAGSDVRSLSTTAKRHGDRYRLNGHKCYITNAAHANGYIVLARTGDPDSLTGFTLFFVPRSFEGVEPSSTIETLGNRGALGEVHFRDVDLPSALRIGGEGHGLLLQLAQFDHERTIIAVRMAAMARWHLERTVEHCRDRATFGRPLIDNQVIQFRLATHFTEVEELEQLTYRCVRLLASEYRANPLIPIAKLAGARVLREVADTCMQLHAGDGYQEPHLAQRFFRDARALSMAGGTDEMMLEAIGRTL